MQQDAKWITGETLYITGGLLKTEEWVLSALWVSMKTETPFDP